MLKNNKGFTLIELLIVIAIIGILALCFTGAERIFRGNCWYSENGVLKELQIIHNPNIVKITTRRNIFNRSVVIAIDKENNVIRYSLDSNIFFNYDLVKEQ